MTALVEEWGDLAQARRRLQELQVDPRGVQIMAPKSVQRLVRLQGLSVRAANILKQEMLARGGEVALPRGASLLGGEWTEAVVMGTAGQFASLVDKLREQPVFGLPRLAEALQQALAGYDTCRWTWRLRDRTLTLGERTLVMGILNVTPDSFSDGGRYRDPLAAVEQARRMVAEGVDIIDVGGESTRPGAVPVEEAEERARVLPVVERLARELDVPISVDTYKSGVAAAALDRGAHIVNDVWGLQRDPAMAGVVAKHRAGVVVMHNQPEPTYRSLMGEVAAFLRRSLELAQAAGSDPEQVVLDPGIGFGKTPEHNLELIRRLRELKSVGRPVLLGPSRKSFIGLALGGLPPQERLEGTAAAVAVGIVRGADVVRVHDVQEMVRVVRVTDALVR